MPIEWFAEQVCGECGKGVFTRLDNGAAICIECGHEHPMDPWNLGATERFEWHPNGWFGADTLHVVCYREEVSA